MKKIVVLAFFLLAGSFVNAQTSAPQNETRFGFTSGYVNTSFISDAPHPILKVVDNPTFGKAIFVGAFADIFLGSSTFFKPEVIYHFGDRTAFLEVSPLFKQYLFNSRFHVLAGPQVRFIIGPLAENYKRTGLELAGGLGYDITKDIFIQAKYSYEFTNRYEEGVEPTGGNEMHFETFSIGLGYRF